MICIYTGNFRNIKFSAPGNMKIGYDSKRAFCNRSGLGNYSRWLIQLMEDEHQTILFCPKKGTYFEEAKGRIISKPTLISSGVWRSWLMGKHPEFRALDVFHGLSNELPIYTGNIPTIVTIHDVLYKDFPELYPIADRQIFHLKTKWALKKANRILVPSKATQDRIREFYPGFEEKIYIHYQNAHEDFRIPRTQNPREIFQWIYVSSFTPRKNHMAILNALLDLKDTKQHVVFCGLEGPTLPMLTSFIQQHQLPVTLEVNPTRMEIIQRMDQSHAFIYPSLGEGFGIPLLEAMCRNLPILAAQSALNAEIVGNAGCLYEPKNLTDFMLKWVNAPHAPKSYQQAISAELRRFSNDLLKAELMGHYQWILG